MRVYVVQMESAYTNKQVNLAKILDWINKGADAQADLIIFSEMCLTGYNCHQKYIDLAERIVPEPGPSVRQVMQLAKKRGVYVILGMPEINNTFLYNSAAVFGPQGLVTIHRKLVIPAGWIPPDIIVEEEAWFMGGEKITTFDTHFGKVGLNICADAFQPEVDRASAHRGAMILVCIAAAPSGAEQAYHTLVPARALENCSWYIFSNHLGSQDGLSFTGGACIVNPSGYISVKASMGAEAKEEAITKDIDLERSLPVRLRDMFVRDARADLLRQAADIIENEAQIQ